MKLENQVITLEQAVKLKSLGIAQHSLFAYIGHGGKFVGDEKPCHNNFYATEEFAFASAFTLSEIGAMLNPAMESGILDAGDIRDIVEKHSCDKMFLNYHLSFNCSVLIFVLEKGLLNVEDCNAILTK